MRRNKMYCFFSYSNETPIDLCITRRGDIMIEQAEDNSIRSVTIKEAVKAKCINHCWDIPSRREFSRSCQYNNIVFEKWGENEDEDWELMDSITLAELRKSPSRLKKFLEEKLVKIHQKLEMFGKALKVVSFSY